MSLPYGSEKNIVRRATQEKTNVSSLRSSKVDNYLMELYEFVLQTYALCEAAKKFNFYYYCLLSINIFLVQSFLRMNGINLYHSI